MCDRMEVKKCVKCGALNATTFGKQLEYCEVCGWCGHENTYVDNNGVIICEKCRRRLKNEVCEV